VREGLIALFFLMFLAGIGLTAQIYNIKSDGWGGILLCSDDVKLDIYAPQDQQGEYVSHTKLDTIRSHPFDKPVVLLNNVVEVFTPAYLDSFSF